MTIQDNNTLYEATLTNHTPAMIGGANQGWININGSIDYPRPTDIAGKTRWWLRSIISAGIYEQYNKGIPINQLDKIAGELMGKIGNNETSASKISIILRPVNLHEYSLTLRSIKNRYYQQLKKLLEEQSRHSSRGRRSQIRISWHLLHNTCLNELIHNKGECPEENEVCCALASSRVLLGLLGKDIREAIPLLPIPPKTIQLKIQVKKRPGAELNEIEERILGLALGLALYASGIGRAQTRGYGKLELLEEEKSDSILGETIREVYERLSTYHDAWEYIAKQALSISQEYLSRKQDLDRMIKSTKTSNYIPRAYTLHPKTIDAWSGVCTRIYSPKMDNCTRCKPGQTWCTVAAISQAVTKQYMKVYLAWKSGKLYGGKAPWKLHGAPLITMYLGMERSVKKEGKITGYIFNNDYNRMLSPLIFVPLKQRVNSILFARIIEPSLLERYVKYIDRREHSIRELLRIIKQAQEGVHRDSDIVQLLEYIKKTGIPTQYYESLYDVQNEFSILRLRFFAELPNRILGLEKVLECDSC